MNMEKLENVLSSLDTGMVDEALEMRYARFASVAQEKWYAKKAWKAAAGIAAMFALVCGLLYPWREENGNISVPRPTADYPVIPNPTSQTTGTYPGFVQAYSTPSLEEVYRTEPFATVLPQRVLSGAIYEKSYKVEEDPRIDLYDPCHLRLYYHFSEDETFDTMSITVIKYDPSGLHADLSDPNTYKFSIYYSAREEGKLDGELTSVFGMIRAEEITEELMNDRIYVFKDGLCQASIDLICGDHVVKYHYSRYGKAITGAEFYDMVTSSEWFQSST